MNTMEMRINRPALYGALSGLLPTPQQTDLLNACLSTGERSRQAWRNWQRSIHDPIKELGQGKQGYKRLLPLLFTSLHDNNVPLDKVLLTYLRTAFVREEMRYKVFHSICHAVFQKLNDQELAVMVIGGTGLAESVYRSPYLRHCHDLDLLVKEQDLDAIIRALKELDIVFTRRSQNLGTTVWILTHISDLPIVLHSQLFSIPFYNVSSDSPLGRCQWQRVAGVSMRTLSPCDHLLYVCGNAAASHKRESLGWICDSWMIIHRTASLDWEEVYFEAKRRRLILPFSVLLTYLSCELQATVPEEIRKKFLHSGGRADWLTQDAALFGSRMRTREGKRTLIKNAPTWRSKYRVLRWLLLPSPRYLRWLDPNAEKWNLSIYYVLRLVKYVHKMGRAYYRKSMDNPGQKNTFMHAKRRA